VNFATGDEREVLEEGIGEEGGSKEESSSSFRDYS
jgi:hypothetical protein